MVDEEWAEGTLYDDQGELALARIRHRLHCTVGADGFSMLAGEFRLQEEYSPLHTGMAQLACKEGGNMLVRVLRVSRPGGEGELEVVEPQE